MAENTDTLAQEQKIIVEQIQKFLNRLSCSQSGAGVECLGELNVF